MNAADALKETSKKIGHSVTFKLLTICTLILLLLIPTTMVKSLIYEREGRKQQVINEITYKWGQSQSVTGPVLSIPYIEPVVDKNGKVTRVTKYLHILPDRVNINSDIAPEIRYRGLYEAVLYNTNLIINGSFPQIAVNDLRVAPENIVWSGAFISMGISDMRGIKERIAATFDGQNLSMAPGIETADVIQSGVSAPIHLDGAHKSYPFHFSLNLNGSRQINFSPVGKVTTVVARSEWKDPSFGGAFLPVERKVTDKGFYAKWKILDLNRNYPQHWKGSGHDIYQSSFGVTLFNPVDVYQKSMRTAKYALMFIVFTFMAFFITEVMNRLRVHPVQYLLIGLGVIIFYTLLLSISEHLNFGGAYLMSAVAIISLITGYAHAIIKKQPVTVMVGGILTVLYGYLYIVLQQEDYALLMGSVGLFLVLSIIMFMTRKIDWYAIQQDTLKPRSVLSIEAEKG